MQREASSGPGIVLRLREGGRETNGTDSHRTCRQSVQHESRGVAASAVVCSRARESGESRGEGGEAVRSGVPQGRGLHLRRLPLEESPR